MTSSSARPNWPIPLWPDAASPAIQAIRHEGAPRHFFLSLAEAQRGTMPDMVLLTNWETLLFGLARDARDLCAVEGRTDAHHVSAVLPNTT